MKPIIHLSIGVAAGAALVWGGSLLIPREAAKLRKDIPPPTAIARPAHAEPAMPALPVAKAQPPVVAVLTQESQIASGKMPVPAGALIASPAKSATPFSPSRSTASEKTVASARPKSTPLVNPAAYATAPQTSGSYGAVTSPGMVEVMLPNAMPGESTPMLPASLVEPGEELPMETRVGIDNLAKEFSEDVNATIPAADDPQYREDWDEAQILNDILFKARYGAQAFRAQHIKAAQEANATTE